MIQVLGSVIVLLSVLGGFVLEGGHLLALWHPTEILIIVGAAFGAFLTSNPPKVSKQAFVEALALPKSRPSVRPGMPPRRPTAGWRSWPAPSTRPSGRST